MIQKQGKKYRVVSHDGKHMGTYDTEEEAKKRLREIEYFKHQKQGKK